MEEGIGLEQFYSSVSDRSDTASGNQVLALLRESAARFGATVLLATHSAEAAAIAGTRVHLRDGRIEAIE